MARFAHFDHETIDPAVRAPACTEARVSTLKSLVLRVRQALEVRRQRRALLGLCERMRNDIGLSQADVYREASRPFLDVPDDLGQPCRKTRHN